MMNQLPRSSGRSIGDKFSDITLLLQATKAEGYDEYYNTRAPLLGPEISIGNVEKLDMGANFAMAQSILELFNEGQTDFAWDWMTLYQNDWKASMSIDKVLLERLTSEEIRYTQSQTLHEYQHPPEKHGLFGKKTMPPLPPGGR